MNKETLAQATELNAKIQDLKNHIDVLDRTTARGESKLDVFYGNLRFKMEYFPLKEDQIVNLYRMELEIAINDFSNKLDEL